MTSSTGQVPYDQMAERAVLGAVLLENKCLDTISGVIDEEDFYVEANRHIFAVMRDLRRRGIGVDHVTVGSELQAKGILKNIGGPMALAELTDAVATTANVDYYARIVHERSAMRDVIVAARSVAEKSYPGNDPDGVEAKFAALQDAMHRLSRTRMPASLLAMGDAVMENYSLAAHGRTGVPLPWPTMNAMTAGMWPKTMTMFVARPGIGKCQKFDTPICCARTGRYLEIRQIVQERRDVFSRGADGRIVRVTPDAWLATGRKECLKVELYSGREMSQTPEHPFMTVDGWKRTDELKVGDYVEIVGAVPPPEDAISVTTHEAILLGGMLADGGVTHNCSFTKSDREIIALMKSSVEYFGGELIHREGEPLCQYHAIRSGGRSGHGANPVREVLIGLGCKMVLSKDKEIPARVFQYDNDSLARFLGIFWSCDGSFPVSDSGYVTAEIGLASKIMIQQLQRLFLRFGIHGRVRHKPVKLNGSVFDSWVYKVYATSLGDFRDIIPIYGEKAAAAALLKDCENPNVDNIPMTTALADRIKSFVLAIQEDDRARKYRDMEIALGKQTAFSVSHLYRRETVSRRTFSAFVDAFGCQEFQPLLVNRWDRVVGVSDDGEHDVYDLTVNGTHSFVANDIVVHNTMVAVIAARHAWMNGYRVLIVSPEMSRTEIAERFFAIHSTVSYQRIVSGSVSDFEMPKLQATIDACKVQEGLWIMDSDDDLTPRGIEAAVRACRPGLLAIDSLYDLRIKGERRDKLLVALEWFKNAVKHFDMAGTGFVQLNRAAEVSEKKGGGVRLGTIALADEIGQDSHAVFALEQDKDMRADRKLRFKPLKLRRGTYSGDGVEVYWDFSNMVFSEIDSSDDSFEDDATPF